MFTLDSSVKAQHAQATHLTGRAWNLGSAASSSSSACAVALNRDGRARDAVTSAGDCGGRARVLYRVYREGLSQAGRALDMWVGNGNEGSDRASGSLNRRAVSSAWHFQSVHTANVLRATVSGPSGWVCSSAQDYSHMHATLPHAHLGMGQTLLHCRPVGNSGPAMSLQGSCLLQRWQCLRACLFDTGLQRQHA